MSTHTAPIVLFAYDRLTHLQRTIEALRGNHQAAVSRLIIFSDAGKSIESQERVEQVREYLGSIDGFESVRIHTRGSNAGLARSIIEGVSAVCSEFGEAIVLEDDMITSPWFLQYMNDGLDTYRADHRVASIHGYCYPTNKKLPVTFFLRGADCWGWATWERAWSRFNTDGGQLLAEIEAKNYQYAFDLNGTYGFTEMLKNQIDGKNDSWAVRWHASCFIENLLTLYPGVSLVENIGNDATGTHGGYGDDFSARVTSEQVLVNRIELAQCDEAVAAFAEFMRGTKKHTLTRILRGLSKRLKGRW